MRATQSLILSVLLLIGALLNCGDCLAGEVNICNDSNQALNIKYAYEDKMKKGWDQVSAGQCQLLRGEKRPISTREIGYEMFILAATALGEIVKVSTVANGTVDNYAYQLCVSDNDAKVQPEAQKLASECESGFTMMPFQKLSLNRDDETATITFKHPN